MKALATSLPLRDIHLPATIAWWPPAPIWIVCCVLLSAAILLPLLWRRYRRQQRTSLRFQAFTELAQIRARYPKQYDAQRLLQELSALLRRVALGVYASGSVAHLTGSVWLQWLDRGDPKECRFTRGAGQVFAQGPYSQQVEFDVNNILLLVEDWLSVVTATQYSPDSDVLPAPRSETDGSTI